MKNISVARDIKRKRVLIVKESEQFGEAHEITKWIVLGVTDAGSFGSLQ